MEPCRDALVSIVTIFFNGDRFIAEAIESVLAQTHPRWELLLVDDGSTDRATHIARDFAQRFPDRIRYLEHEGHANRGMSAARNLGLRHAQGSFISYLDADDVWQPEKLTEQLALLQAHPEAAYVYGPLELWRSWSGRPSDHDELQELGLEADRVIAPPDLLKLFLQNEKNIPSGILIRAEIFEEKGGYDPAFTGMYEDLVMHAKICLTQPVYAAAKSWYRYRQHPDSCNAQAWRSGRDQEARLAFLRWLEKYLRELGQAEGEVWEITQEQLRALRQPAPLRRVPQLLRRQAGRAVRLARKTLRGTRRALSTPPVILCYHRVLEAERDPHLLTVTPENFRAQLQVIRQLGQPVALDAVSETDAAFPKAGVVLTFDDGYLDNLEIALPILREFDVPATIYIATGAVNSDREFWWDDLERLLLGPLPLPRILRLQINGRPREWDLGAEMEQPNNSWNVLAGGEWSARQKLFVDLHASLRPLAEPKQQEVLAQLRALTGVTTTAARPLYRCVTTAELELLAAEPLLTLGAHTVTHCDLDYRTAEEQAAEINGSRAQLQGWLHRAVDHFSYPYGSFNESAMAICARGNFRSAVSCLEGAVERGVPRHCLPRFFVRNWDGPEFKRQLQGFFHG